MDFEGAKNATIISCEIVNTTRNQINTEWSVTNFRGVSSFQILINNPEIFHFSGDPINTWNYAHSDFSKQINNSKYD